MRGLIIDVLSPVVKELLQGHLQLDEHIFVSSGQLADMIGDYEVLLMRVDPFIDRAILDKAKKLQIIAVAAAGLNHIDLDYARQKGIEVVNAPAMNAQSVAELAIGRIIDLLRFVPAANYEVKHKGIWDKYEYLGFELAGKTLGLIAMGKIGTQVAELARAFGMSVLAFDPFLSDDMIKERGARPVSLNTLLADSDIVSLHAPLTAETRHIINAQSLALMKPGSYLLNMARGELVDEAALYTALRDKKLAGAGADVMAQEPCLGSPLYELDNFIVTPHIGAQTVEAQRRAGQYVGEKVLQLLGRGAG